VVAVVIDQHDQTINCGVWSYNNQINSQDHIKRFLDASLMQILDCLRAPLILYNDDGVGWQCNIIEAPPCSASQAFMLCTEYLVTLLWEQNVLPVVGSVEAMPFLGKPYTILAQMLMKDSSREFTTKQLDLSLYSGSLDEMIGQRIFCGKLRFETNLWDCLYCQEAISITYSRVFYSCNCNSNGVLQKCDALFMLSISFVET
jgi:hypothetical protein